MIRAMQDRVASGPQRHEAFVGFAGETLLVDRDAQEALLIAYYVDRASLDANAERSRQLREQLAGRLGVQLLSVAEYEVAASDFQLPTRSA
ncbi:MAG TPA: hypothetical protein VN973_11200 [Candidatus Dormibacteraeota bacterium]|nr:hypothetical protein [Candidatus Dormibacteraeota bacterium]